MRAAPATFGLLALLLPALAAAAGNLDGDLRTQGKVLFAGTMAGHLDCRIVRFDAAQNPVPGLLDLEADGARFFLVNYPYAALRGSSPNVTTPLGSEVLGEGTFRRLVATTTQAQGSLRLLPLEGEALRVPANLTSFEIVPAAHAPTEEDGFASHNGRLLDSNAPHGLLWSPDAAGRPFVADTLAMLFGADILLDGRAIATGEFHRPDLSAGEPTGTARLDRFDRIVLVVEARAATLRLGGGGQALWRHELAGLAGALEGRLVFEAAQTGGRFNGTDWREASGLLQVDGGFHATASHDRDGGAWHLEGTATAIVSEGVTVFGVPAWAASAGAVGTAALAVALARLWPLLAALRHRDGDALANANRVKVLQSIGENPGYTAMDLARATGLHRSTVNFHLEVLRRAGLVDVQRQGRFEHFLLDSRSFRFAAAPAPEGGEALAAPEVFSTIRHPGRRAIFQALLEASGPLTYQGLAEAWRRRGGPGMKRTTFLHHVGLLERGGLVQRTRAGRAVAWSLGIDYAAILRTQGRLFLATKSRQEILDAVAAGPVDAEALAGRLAGVPDVPARLRELHAAGFLDVDGGAYRLNHRGVFQVINAGRGA